MRKSDIKTVFRQEPSAEVTKSNDLRERAHRLRKFVGILIGIILG